MEPNNDNPQNNLTPDELRAQYILRQKTPLSPAPGLPPKLPNGRLTISDHA
jgi:hypothetical protein